MSTRRIVQVSGKPSLGQGDLKLTVKYKSESLRIVESPFGMIFDLEDACLVGEPGTPGFPMQLLRLALPPHSDVTNFQVAITKKANVTQKPVFVAPIQEPRPGGGAKPDGTEVIKRSWFRPQRAEIEKPAYVQVTHGVTLPRLEGYQRILVEPAPVVRIAAIEHRGVATVLTLEVSPVSQNKEGIVELMTEIKITLTYESTTAPKIGELYISNRDFRPARTASEARRLTTIVKSEVLNPGWVADISTLLPRASTQYDYLIITDNQQWDPGTMNPTVPVGDLVGTFQTLVNWKKRRGLRARVITLTDIVQGAYGDFTTNARDLQEVLRNFLKWAYSHWGISWVLLGGDVCIIPVRVVTGELEGSVPLGTNNPPDENRSYWTGAYLKMHVVDLVELWPNWPLILVNPALGTRIPYDPTGTSSAVNPGWYYTTNNTYETQTAGPTDFVRVNGPASLLNTNLQWLYRWNQIPTDLYYSSLIGSCYDVPGRHDWDLNDNGLYAQHGAGVLLDGVHFTADIGVGRAPVTSVAEAGDFVNKVIAYEQFRRPDSTALNLNWPRRLTVVSSNWGRRISIWRTDATPPGDNMYYHDAADPYSLIKLRDPFEDIVWHLFTVLTETEIGLLPYDREAADRYRGWYFAKSDTDLSVSENAFPIFGKVYYIPDPTQWVVVYGYSNELVPDRFIFDKATADGSMVDQEILRKQITTDFPGIDLVNRLYEDEVDLPAPDATSPPVKHLTGSRLRETLNHGQHIVSLSGHGNAGGCCTLDRAAALNLTNGYHTFIVYADSCLTNNFLEENSMSENLLRSRDGGAVAYIGSTRFSWIGKGDDYQREFFRRLKIVRHLALLNDSRFSLPNSGLDRWIKFSLNLLGDPEMPIWVGKPTAMKITYPSETHARENVSVTVKSSSGNPIANAVVCFSSDDNWLTIGNTNSNGQVVLNLNPPVLGDLEVVITAQDHRPHYGSILVKEKLLDVIVRVGGMNNVNWGGIIQFRATVDGSDNKEVKWSLAVSGAGTIGPKGEYQAPFKNCHNTAIATSVANPNKSGEMSFTVTKHMQ